MAIFLPGESTDRIAQHGKHLLYEQHDPVSEQRLTPRDVPAHRHISVRH